MSVAVTLREFTYKTRRRMLIGNAPRQPTPRRDDANCRCPNRALGQKSAERFGSSHRLATATHVRPRAAIPMTLDVIKAIVPRHRRRSDRVHAGVLDRTSAAGRAFLRFRRRGFRQDLRGADPARCHPGAAVDLLARLWQLFLGMFTDPRRGASSSACWSRSCRPRSSARSPTASSRACCSTSGSSAPC